MIHSCDAGCNSGGELGISAGWPQFTFYLSSMARFAKTMRLFSETMPRAEVGRTNKIAQLRILDHFSPRPALVCHNETSVPLSALTAAFTGHSCKFGVCSRVVFDFTLVAHFESPVRLRLRMQDHLAPHPALICPNETSVPPCALTIVCTGHGCKFGACSRAVSDPLYSEV
jgi:hypothetical protein